VLWSARARAHLRWTLRERRADRADRTGRAFRYEHEVAGSFIYHPCDYLSRRVFLYEQFERAELQFAVEQARLGGLIVDVGANIGLYSVACARAAGSGGRVIAVEPSPRTFAKLADTCIRLGLSNVTCVRAAASRANGTASLVNSDDRRDVHQHLADLRPHDAAGEVEVETRRLDHICGEQAGEVTFLKLDIEGHELSALDGAAAILANGQARLVVEFYPTGLAAAGGTVAELWARLHATHDCSTVIAPDGSALAPAAASIAGTGEETFNTLWVPARDRS
jgi:FkbM family methyltransferase